MKRIDLAINDHTGILDIPELAEKCRKREYIGKSRSYKFYQSGELIKHREDDREYMGHTLYLGSLKSDVYFILAGGLPVITAGVYGSRQKRCGRRFDWRRLNHQNRVLRPMLWRGRYANQQRFEYSPHHA